MCPCLHGTSVVPSRADVARPRAVTGEQRTRSLALALDDQAVAVMLYFVKPVRAEVNCLGIRATILLRIDWLSCLIGALLW